MAKLTLQPQDKYVVRFPDGMRDRIKAAAEASGRSMNAEIIATLEREYPAAGSIQSLRAAIAEKLPLLARAHNEEEERRLEAEILDLTRLIEVAASDRSGS